ncbi:MAG TPA: ACT domain-containing protein [Candidatus Acidoferrum sp.]|nr:ACT domain-containing protein [Candidatus Acidoferrum sp.]
MNLAQRHFQLSILPESYAIVGLSPRASIPAWATQGSFFSVTRTPDELSIVVDESLVPVGVQSQGGWRVMKVHGPFVLAEVGVLASLAGPLAAAKISAFVVSTFDTDYLLVANENLAPAVSTLERVGHTFQRGPSE